MPGVVLGARAIGIGGDVEGPLPDVDVVPIDGLVHGAINAGREIGRRTADVAIDAGAGVDPRAVGANTSTAGDIRTAAYSGNADIRNTDAARGVRRRSRRELARPEREHWERSGREPPVAQREAEPAGRDSAPLVTTTPLATASAARWR